MYADVVVLTYQAPEIDSYTYEVPKKLEGLIKSGQLVQVPFGKRTPVGIILSADYQPPTTNYQIKPINSIIFQMPILLSYQIKLLKWMAFYYHAPMVNCLEAILPELPTKVERLKTNANLVRVARAEGVPASARSPRTPINIDSTNTTTDFRLRSRTRTSDGTSPRQDPPPPVLPNSAPVW